MNQLTPEQTSFALLGALVAVAAVLLLIVLGGAVLLVKFIGYAARFKGMQLGRNARNELNFGGIIDESRKPASASLWGRIFQPAKRVGRRGATLVVDKEGHPVPAKDLQ